jgi:hypothetical protein
VRWFGALALAGGLATTVGAPPADPWLVDATEQVGLDARHWNGMTGEMYLPEIMGPGGALLDYDGDGDLDLYLGQGSLLGPGKALADALVPPPPPAERRDRLFRNEAIGPDGRPGPLRFREVTREAGLAGLAATGSTMGVAAGDVDNDGHSDLYVSRYGAPDRLLRNRGDGTFEDVTTRAGLGDPRWTASASFADFDRDGWLDLFVTAYVDAPLERPPDCYSTSSRRDYCGPEAFPPIPDRLYRNHGDGTFEDVTTRLLPAHPPQPGLGVVSGDFDQDGRPDFYVANDGRPNHLWLQQADGRFVDGALLAGVAVNQRGEPEASMGITAADLDGDGRRDLFLTHLSAESNTLYLAAGEGLFDDRSRVSGLAAPSLPWTGFGTGPLDLDNDGDLDLLVVNGAVRIQEEQAQRGDLLPLGQPDQLFLNEGRGGGGVRFRDISAEGGTAFTLAEVGRAALLGDLDNDGDTDAVVLTNNGPARVLLNQRGARAPWLGLRLVDRHGRDALGAWVELVRTGAPPLVRWVATDGSFGAAHDPRVLFGLGGGGEVTGVEVHWPDGSREVWPPPTPSRYTILRQGSGKAVRATPAADGALRDPGGGGGEKGATMEEEP